MDKRYQQGTANAYRAGLFVLLKMPNICISYFRLRRSRWHGQLVQGSTAGLRHPWFAPKNSHTTPTRYGMRMHCLILLCCCHAGEPPALPNDCAPANQLSFSRKATTSPTIIKLGLCTANSLTC